METRTKLRLAFGLLFAIVLCFGGISLYYMNKIASSSKDILKDNYESLSYLGKMRSILDENELLLTKLSVDQFSLEQQKEKNNITENGEREAVSGLSEAYKVIINPSTNIHLNTYNMSCLFCQFDRLTNKALNKRISGIYFSSNLISASSLDV